MGAEFLNNFITKTDDLARRLRQWNEWRLEQIVSQEKRTIELRIDQVSTTKAEQLANQRLLASLEWVTTEEKRLALLIERNQTYRAQLQKWLNWTLGNLHSAANGTTFFYLAWTPLVIFWSVIITMSVPTAIACPKPDGICHNTRMMALRVRSQVTAIPRFLSKFVGL